MTDTMAAPEVPEAERNWLEGKKIIHSMVKRLEQIEKEEDNSKKLLADLEAVELNLQTLRLVCMTITFTDFKFAHKNRVLDRLWHVHTLISAEFKRGLQRHRGHGQIVQFRNIEKQYGKHLKTAQYFYKGFVERLSARYRLRSLQRVANSMQAASVKVDEVIDAEEADLSHELTVACYRTVLHMGDLARYRLNVSRQKGHSPDIAMTYYALAQDLMPQEGDAHHQMAVVLADHRRDFDVVYHFLRSWSVEKPFTLTPKNLASEYKKLLQPPSASRKNGNAPPDPYDLFGTWFVRLHANYFKGEEFSSQTELEREVLHRWEALLRKSERPEYLQKAILMNIAAYDIALKRVKSEWTATGSQSCQFVLRFMVQTILVLSRVLETETQRLFEEPAPEEEAPAAPAAPAPAASAPAAAPKAKPAAPAASEGKNNRTHARGGRGGDSSKPQDKKASPKKSSPPDTCLALFRVCMAWIAIHQEDLVKFKDYLAPHVADMHRSITRCMTLFVEIISATDAMPVSYLLPEDAEVIGLAPLESWVALHESGPETPFKRHCNEEGVERKDAAHETLARIYDIVECTVRLVHNPDFPWELKIVQEDGRNVTKVLFTENHVPMLQTAIPITPSGPSVPATAQETTTSPLASTQPRAASGTTPPSARSANQPTTNTNTRGRNRNKRQQDARKTPQPQADTVQIKKPARQQAPPAAQAQPRPPSAAQVSSEIPAVPAVTIASPESVTLPPLSTITAPTNVTPSIPANTINTPRAITRLPQQAPRKASYKDFDNDDDFFVDPNEEAKPPPRPLSRVSSVAPPSHHAPSESEVDFADTVDDATYSRLETFLSPPELHPYNPSTTPPHVQQQRQQQQMQQMQQMQALEQQQQMQQLHRLQQLQLMQQMQQMSQMSQMSQMPSMQSSSSFGMNTSTAEDVFGQLQTPSNASAARVPSAAVGARAIPSSPWTNTQQTSASANTNTNSSANANGYSNSLGYYSPYGGAPGLNGTPQLQPARPHANIEEQLAFLTVNKQNERKFSSASAAATSPLPLPSMPSMPSTTSMGMRQPSSGGLAPVNNGRLGSSSYGPDAYDGFARGFPSALSPVGASKQPHSPMNGFSNPWGQPPASSGAGGPSAAPGNMMYSSNFTMNSMNSLPPVQGLTPHGGYRGYDAIYGSQYPSAASSSASAFGSASAASGQGPSQAWQDASTWRRTSSIRDDPTHFRNAVRSTGLMEDTNAYDRNALMSALKSPDKQQQR